MKTVQKQSKENGSIRTWMQVCVFIAAVASGLQFALYVRQASHSLPATIPRPGGVEGFLPIGALLGWRHFLLTGKWDSIHPAAMVIFGFAVLISFLLRKSFCGWFCPVGTVSEWLFAIGHRFGKTVLPPRWVDLPLRGIKYILMLFFVWSIFAMRPGSVADFLDSSYYRMSDAGMLLFFEHMSAAAGISLFLLVVFSLFIRNFWCRYLCPYGALNGLFAMVGPTRIIRDMQACVSCGKCSEVCPNRIDVAERRVVISPECTGCMRCVSACPVYGALALKTAGVQRRWTSGATGIAVIGIYLAFVYIAIISGCWKSGVSNKEFRAALPKIEAQYGSHQY